MDFGLAVWAVVRWQSDGAHVVVINSVQGKVGLPARTSYSASKHALTGCVHRGEALSLT